MLPTSKEMEEKINYWMVKGTPVSEVEKELNEMGMSEEDAIANLRAYKKLKYAGRHFNGVICVIVGAAISFLSCLLAITNPVPELFHVFLYGLTPAGMLILFAGLWLLFEY